MAQISGSMQYDNVSLFQHSLSQVYTDQLCDSKNSVSYTIISRNYTQCHEIVRTIITKRPAEERVNDTHKKRLQTNSQSLQLLKVQMSL